MDDQAREVLKAILAAEGLAVCRDPGRCDLLLRERCGARRKEILWLVGALHENVVPELMAAKPGESIDGCVIRLSGLLKQAIGLQADDARWTVMSWALALGLASEETPPQHVTSLVAQTTGGDDLSDEDLDDEDLDDEDEDDIDDDDLDGEDDDDIEGDVGDQEGIETECPRPDCEFVEYVAQAGSVCCSACGYEYEIDSDGDIVDPGHGVSEVICGGEGCGKIFYWEINEVNHDEGGKQCPYCNFWNRDEDETEWNGVKLSFNCLCDQPFT